MTERSHIECDDPYCPCRTDDFYKEPGWIKIHTSGFASFVSITVSRGRTAKGTAKPSGYKQFSELHFCSAGCLHNYLIQLVRNAEKEDKK